jgi:hypothetical protein
MYSLPSQSESEQREKRSKKQQKQAVFLTAMQGTEGGENRQFISNNAAGIANARKATHGRRP